MPKKVWTEEEKQYVIDNWGILSRWKLKNNLKVSWDAVNNLAANLGLEKPESIEWSDEDKAKLTELSTKLHYKDIADVLNRTPKAIELKAKKEKITLIKDRRIWTDEEDDYLRDSWGNKSMFSIMRRLLRSEESIKAEAYRLGLGSFKSNSHEYLFISDIQELLGITKARVKVLGELGLNLKKRKFTGKQEIMSVRYSELLLFLEENKDLWDASRVEDYALGIEPDWLKIKRKEDIINPPKFDNIWTEEEKLIITKMFLLGRPIESVLDKIDRTPKSIKWKLIDLGFDISELYSPIWSDSEKEYLFNNFENDNYKEIALALNRTTKAVYNKAGQLKLRKYNKK